MNRSSWLSAKRCIVTVIGFAALTADSLAATPLVYCGTDVRWGVQIVGQTLVTKSNLHTEKCSLQAGLAKCDDGVTMRISRRGTGIVIDRDGVEQPIFMPLCGKDGVAVPY